MAYPSIDMVKTGIQLKKYIQEAGLSVKDVQEYLQLSCPQPIYRWLSGKILPSVDHLLTLSELLGLHMEELLVKQQAGCMIYDMERLNQQNRKKLFQAYWQKILT